MIRAPNRIAVCVRKPDGGLARRTEGIKGSRLRGVPVVRGVTALGETLSQGMRAMLWSAQVAAGIDPQEPAERQVRAVTAASLGLIVDTVRESDLVQEVDGLTFVVDPETHGLAGEVRVSLADDEERTAFILTSSKPVSEWDGLITCNLRM